MIYLKKNEETQNVNIPKNGDYQGRLSYEDGYNEGYDAGLVSGKLNPYTTKGVFIKNGTFEKQYAIDWNQDLEKAVSWMDDNNIFEISFFPVQNGGLVSSSGAYFDFYLFNNKLIVRIQDKFIELDCEFYFWHTLKLQGNYVWLDGKAYNLPLDNTFIGTMYVGRSRRDGSYYRGYISYIYATEDNGIEMYYYYNIDTHKIGRSRKENGVWFNQEWDWVELPYTTNTPPMNGVFINVPIEGGNCPELTELNVNSNGRYEGAYNVVNVDVPDENGSYDEGYTNGYNDGKAEGGGSCNLQDKWVGYNSPDELTDTIFVDVYPDEGYDGMGRVVADVSGLMQYKYDEGYNQGKNEGGGSCNLGSLDSDTNSLTHNDNLLWGYVNELSPELDGWAYISIDYRPLRKEIAEQTKNKIESELQTLTITENGHYEPAKVKYMEFDSDDIFYLGEFNSRYIYDITIKPKSSNYDSKIFGGWVDGTFMGLSIIDGDIVARWGKYKAQAPYIEGEITHIVIKPYAEDNSFIIGDQIHGWWEEDSNFTDDFNTDMYLGETEGRTANFNFYKLTVYENYEGWVNDLNDVAVVTPWANNQIEYNGIGGWMIKDNIGDGAYCGCGEEPKFLGFKEVVVDVPQEGGSCNIEETRWVEPTPADVDGSGYLVYHKSEGYDGMDRVALNMNGYNALKYNEGYNDGKAEGGGSCNLGELNVEWQSNWNENNYYADKQGYDGYSYVHIDATNALKEKYDEGYEDAKNNDAHLTSSAIEKKYNVIALRTENIHDADIILDRTGLVGMFDYYEENNFISYTQNKNGLIITQKPEFSSPYVSEIKKGALNWNTIEYFYSYTINNFGVDMTRDTGSNVREIHIKNNEGVGTGEYNIHFRTGCFATSNLLNKIVFYEPYYINVEENAFEGVSSSGEVIVVGEVIAENRAKYDTLMSQLGDGWTLRFE